MEKLLAILGLFLIVGGTYLFSNKKSEIKWASVGYAFIGQLVLAFLLIKTPAWKGVEWVSNGVSWLLDQSREGIDFVFGGLVPEGGYVFFIYGLLPIVFTSGLIGILFHFNILQKFITLVGNTIARLLKVDTLIAVNGITNMFLGQSDALFVTKSYLPNAKDSVIFATLVGGMTSISTSVMGLYSSLGADMTWIVASMPLTVFSTFVLTQILMPTEYDGTNIEVEDDKGVNFLDTMMIYANTGFKSVIGITVALIAFISMVAMINNFIGLFFNGLTLQKILGIVFYPMSYLMGVSADEVGLVSEILATKFITNETVALGLPEFSMLSANTKAMVTVTLMGFAGLGSIGVLIGGYSAIAPNKVKLVARLGMKALITATFVNIMTGAVVGLFL